MPPRPQCYKCGTLHKGGSSSSSSKKETMLATVKHAHKSSPLAVTHFPGPHAACRTCFPVRVRAAAMAATRHKQRCGVYFGERLLLALAGGCASRTLLDVYARAMTPGNTFGSNKGKTKAFPATAVPAAGEDSSGAGYMEEFHGGGRTNNHTQQRNCEAASIEGDKRADSQHVLGYIVVKEEAARVKRVHPAPFAAIGAVHVDESELDDATIPQEPSRDVVGACRKWCVSYPGVDIAVHIVPLSDIFVENGREGDEAEGVSSSAAERQRRLRELFQAMPSSTARTNLLHALRWVLLARAAKRLRYDAVVIGECASRLSARMVADISQGRGMQVSSASLHAHTRFGARFVFPLRDMPVKALALYAHYEKLDYCVRGRLSPLSMGGGPLAATVSEKRDIHSLCNAFVTRLQCDFPSTTQNVLRTCSKLLAPPALRECAVCGCAVAERRVREAQSELGGMFGSNPACVPCHRVREAIVSRGGQLALPFAWR